LKWTKPAVVPSYRQGKRPGVAFSDEEGLAAWL
jgi:hypothetical protein